MNREIRQLFFLKKRGFRRFFPQVKARGTSPPPLSFGRQLAPDNRKTALFSSTISVHLSFFVCLPAQTAFTSIQRHSAALPEPWLNTKSQVEVSVPNTCRISGINAKTI